MPDAVVDCCAGTAADVAAVHPHLPADAHLVELSSQDVYRAYELMRDGSDGVPVPGDEDSPLRQGRYPYRGLGFGADDYDKLDVEPATLARAGTVFRLAMVYGEHDPQRREEMVLRRVRAGRTRIPVGSGGWLWTRLYAGDAAAAVELALRTDAARGAVLNLGEARTSSTVGWMRRGARRRRPRRRAGHRPRRGSCPMTSASPAAGPSTCSPAPAGPRTSSAGTRRDPRDSIRRSVTWHLAHPPAEADPDFSPDEVALASADR